MNQPADLHAESIHRVIEKLAYFRAELRGFAPGHELCDWLAAEALVHRYMRPASAEIGERQGTRSEAGRGELGALNEIAAGMADANLYPSIFLPTAEPR